jgi:hypothetical protein
VGFQAAASAESAEEPGQCGGEAGGGSEQDGASMEDGQSRQPLEGQLRLELFGKEFFIPPDDNDEGPRRSKRNASVVLVSRLRISFYNVGSYD